MKTISPELKSKLLDPILNAKVLGWLTLILGILAVFVAEDTSAGVGALFAIWMGIALIRKKRWPVFFLILQMILFVGVLVALLLNDFVSFLLALVVGGWIVASAIIVFRGRQKLERGII